MVDSSVYQKVRGALPHGADAKTSGRQVIEVIIVYLVGVGVA